MLIILHIQIQVVKVMWHFPLFIVLGLKIRHHDSILKAAPWNDYQYCWTPLNWDFLSFSLQFLSVLTSCCDSCVAPKRRSRSVRTKRPSSLDAPLCWAVLRSLSCPSVRCVTSRPPVSYVLLALHLLLACRSTLRVTLRSPPQKRKPPSAGARAAGGDILKGCPRGVSRLPIGRARCQSKGGGGGHAHRHCGARTTSGGGFQTGSFQSPLCPQNPRVSAHTFNFYSPWNR